MTDNAESHASGSARIQPGSSPRAIVRSGILSTQVHRGEVVLTELRAKVVSASAQGDGPGARLTTPCKSIALLNAKAIQPKPHPVWHHRLPPIWAPDLGVHRMSLHSLHLARPLLRMHRLTFKPAPMAIRETPPLPPPRVQSKLGWAQHQPMLLTSYPLNAFGPKSRHYYSWYARERLKLDLQRLTLIGICDPLPSQPMNLLRWQVGPFGVMAPLVTLSGEPQEAGTGRHGLICQSAEGYQLHKLPPPNL